MTARGHDALSFAARDPSMLRWDDPEGDAWVGYADTGGAWVAATGPIAGPRDVAAVAARFVDAARRAGRRTIFFATERALGPDLRMTLVGEQPIFQPRAWLAGVARHRRLKEQLRRARAKGVHVRRVEPDELREGTDLRAEADALCAAWLATRHMEPMGFVARVDPLQARDDHLYLVAEWRGRVVELLSAVPIADRDAWLVRDVVRSNAPNGTSELLLHALLREVEGASFVTLGLTPLSGDVALPLRAARILTRGLFDFAGLRAFRERLHPTAWEPVWLATPPDVPIALAFFDLLRAFARGDLVRFAALSLWRHPSGAPWAIAMLTSPLTIALDLIALVHAQVSSVELLGWVGFDVTLTVWLSTTALRPRRASLGLGATLTTASAVLWVCRAAALTGTGRAAVAALAAAILRGTAAAWLLYASARAITSGRAAAPAASSRR